ncbi:MAG: hypothetical protein J3Q66DRAFT_337270 [Benniella sp.]|nr:MAG: hypothetical protein J3Q66DRAFT_337270 [Benniella sp.]
MRRKVRPVPIRPSSLHPATVDKAAGTGTLGQVLLLRRGPWLMNRVGLLQVCPNSDLFPRCIHVRLSAESQSTTRLVCRGTMTSTTRLKSEGQVDREFKLQAKCHICPFVQGGILSLFLLFPQFLLGHCIEVLLLLNDLSWYRYHLFFLGDMNNFAKAARAPGPTEEWDRRIGRHLQCLLTKITECRVMRDAPGICPPSPYYSERILPSSEQTVCGATRLYCWFNSNGRLHCEP